MSKKVLSIAGNIEAPSFKILKDIGFTIIKNDQVFTASNNDLILYGYSMIEILGLIHFYDFTKGELGFGDEIFQEYMNFYNEDS